MSAFIQGLLNSGTQISNQLPRTLEPLSGHARLRVYSIVYGTNLRSTWIRTPYIIRIVGGDEKDAVYATLSCPVTTSTKHTDLLMDADFSIRIFRNCFSDFVIGDRSNERIHGTSRENSNVYSGIQMYLAR